MNEIWWNQGDIYFLEVYKKEGKPDVNEAGGTWVPESWQNIGNVVPSPRLWVRGVQYWIEDLLFEKFIRQKEGNEVKWGDLADEKTDEADEGVWYMNKSFFVAF